MEQQEDQIKAIIHDAILAKLAIKRGELEQARQFISYLANIEQHELVRLVRLQGFLPENATLRKIEGIASGLIKQAKKAQKYLAKKNLKRVEAFLDYTIDLANLELIEEQKWKKLIKSPEAELLATIAVELGLREYIKNQIDPYLKFNGHQIDIAFQKLETAKKHTSEFWQGVQTYWGKVQKSFPTFFKSEEAKESIRVELEKEKEKAQSLQPDPSPHMANNTFENLLSGFFDWVLWGLFAYFLVTKNIPRWLRRRKEFRVRKQLVEEIYAKLDLTFGTYMSAIAAESGRTGTELRRISNALDALIRSQMLLNERLDSIEATNSGAIQDLISRTQGIEGALGQIDTSLSGQITAEGNKTRKRAEELFGELRVFVNVCKAEIQEKLKQPP